MATGVSPIGVVLCGGASSRMGQDKARLEIAGRPLALWVAAALEEAGAKPVVAQGGDPPPPLLAVPDSRPGAGPLAGLVDALERHGDILVCPTDVPTVPIRLLTDLVAQARSTEAEVVLARSDRLEPLIGHYTAAALPRLREGLLAGARGPKELLEDSFLPAIAVTTVRVAATDVLNVNTPEDLAQAELVLADRAKSGTDCRGSVGR